ncbi:MAG: hypothetical protein ACRYFX_27150 [Janthinobacterium lividum]
MMLQTPGKIYLADQRGRLETSDLRRLSTFNFGDYADEHRQPLGRLYGFNEETLAGGCSTELRATQASYVLLLPITGDVAFRLASGPSGTVQVEELQGLALAAGDSLQLTNPYEDELISFLHIWLQADVPTSEVAPVFGFDLGSNENQLLEIISNERVFSLSIGRFMGRQEAVYLVPPRAQLFAFILAGAFEVEGRLLHERDGLGLWEAKEVELEALSNNAIVMVLEVH